MYNIKTLVLLFAILICLVANQALSGSPVSTSTKANQCSSIYSKKQLSDRNFNNKETRNLDQGSSKECFLLSFLGALETTHRNRSLNGRDIKFEEAYLMAKKFEHVIYEILANESKLEFNLAGGETYHAMKLIELYGLVPKEIWKPLKPLSEWDFNFIYSEITKQVDKIIVDRNNNPENYKNFDVQAETQKIFKNVFEHYVGILPKPFYFDGIYHPTPQSFGNLYGLGPEGRVDIKYSTLRPYDSVTQTFNLPFYINFKAGTGVQLTPHQTEESQKIFNDVKEALANNRAVIVDVEAIPAFIDPIQGLDHREFRTIFGHGLVVADIDVGSKGEVRALKLKNSYTKWGINGYQWYSVNTIAKALRRIWIFDVNSSIPEPKLNPIN